MSKIIEALKKLLPEDNLTEVASAVDGMLAESKTELEAEFNEKLEEAYTELASELASAEKTAYQGYNEAYVVINDLRGRLELQKEEFEKTLEEGYEEAYQLLLSERGKNNTLEVDIYEEYDKKLSEMKEYIVDKVDQFLQYKGAEIYEQAKRDVINDPRMAEHKVALDKIVNITSSYLSDEERALATSSKLEEVHKQAEELKGQIKMMEARNIRLSHENTKLNEQMRHGADLINESRKVSKKERAMKAKSVSGRGQTVTPEEVAVIREHNGEKVTPVDENTKVLVEGLDLDVLNTLAGTKKNQDN